MQLVSSYNRPPVDLIRRLQQQRQVALLAITVRLPLTPITLLLLTPTTTPAPPILCIATAARALGGGRVVAGVAVGLWQEVCDRDALLGEPVKQPGLVQPGLEAEQALLGPAGQVQKGWGVEVRNLRLPSV